MLQLKLDSLGGNVRVIVAKGGLKEWRSGLKGPDQEALTLDAVVGWKLRFAVNREDRETLNAVVSISGVASRLRVLPEARHKASKEHMMEEIFE